ncbi:uncharacterized protein LOC120635864 [Pararge aegeria]|uniref:Jg27853 protein n=2 Tax=Pararge aegeria TaxID=116150 RepID=A0A8S4S8A1_9NEOP|nr:uncharacterized protein LOC120635864 [Pararge aegeria]CAH2260035.1 jg27853 [Pararge aegeria aegeria]
MSAFKALRDVSAGFEHYLRQVSAELFSAKLSEPFEHVVAKKLRDVKLLTSKFRLLEAKSFADTPQVSEKNKTEQTILDYEEAVSSKIVEQLVVKAITQTNTVKNLLTTPNQKLKPEFIEKKEKIITELTKYGENENQLCFIEDVLEKTETKLLEAQRRWDTVVGKLKDTPKVETNEELNDGPMFKRLEIITEKIELMRWLVAKLVTSRFDQDYDWLSDPHHRLRALAIARQRNDVYE